jgi:predicted RecB family nuclease
MTYPEWKGECKECPWKQVCEDELVAHGDGGHITLLPGITPAKASGHYNAGISSIRELARLDVPTAAAIEAGVAVSDISNPDLNTARYAGKGVKDLTKAIYQARVTLAGKVARAPGVDVVDLPRFDVEVDFDLENTNAPVFPGRDKDGKHSGGPLAYLWGTRTTRRTRKRDGTVTHTVKVQQFTDWTDSDEGEMLAFVQFWDFISDSRSKALSKKKTWGAFHYSSVEPTWMRKLAGKYAGKPGVPTLDEVEDLLSSGDVIDMYVILSRQLVWPTRDHSIKSLAKWARFSWRAEDAGGDNSMLWHRASVCDPDPMERKRNQKRLLDYNVDDVAAQEHLRSWIEKLQSAENAKVRIPSVSAIRRPLPRR